jgi:protein-arginine kinase activator protein McsA
MKDLAGEEREAMTAGHRCDFCEQGDATVHITNQMDGATTHVDLCSDCAKKYGVDDPSGFSLASLVAALRIKEEGRRKPN